MLALLVPGVGMGASGADAPPVAATQTDRMGRLLIIGVGCLAGLLLLVGCAY